MRLQKLNVIVLNTETRLLTRSSSQVDFSCKLFYSNSLVKCVQHCPAGRKQSVHVKVTRLLFSFTSADLITKWRNVAEQNLEGS